jgi:hypothetical protein
VAIARDGKPTEIITESVPEGTYRQLGFQLAIADFPEGARGSIMVQGSYNGALFVYASTLAPEIEFDLESPVEVAEGSAANIAVRFDVASWFLGPDGAAINPSDEANRIVIENNILRSMTAQAAEIEWGDDGDD